MTHGQIIDEIISRAMSRGLLVHYCQNGRACRASPGLPDVIVAGLYGAAFIEAKSERAALTPDQGLWYHTLTAAGETVTVVRPEHVESGALDNLLNRLADPPWRELAGQ